MNYIALATYLLVMIITPGPNNIMVTASGANFGYRASLPHIAGIICGGAFEIILACFGFGALFVEFPILHELLLWMGLAYMFYLSWKMLGLGIGNNKHIGEPLKFMQAALFQLVNPKAWIMAITVASVFLPKTQQIVMPTLIIVSMDALFTFIGTTLWTMFGSSIGSFLKHEKNRRIFNIMMALLLLVTAVWIAINNYE